MKNTVKTKPWYQNIKWSYQLSLILGMIGSALYFISFFVWSNFKITGENLRRANAKLLGEYLAPNYLIMFGAVLLCILGIHLIIRVKKSNLLTKISAYSFSIIQFLIFAVSLWGIIFISINGGNALVNKNLKEFTSLLATLRFLLFFLMGASFAVFAYTLKQSEEGEFLTKSGFYPLLGISFLFVVTILIQLIIPAFDKTMRLLLNHYNYNVIYPYSLFYPTLNGFSLASFKTINLIFQESAIYDASEAVRYNASSFLAMTILVEYLALFAAFFWNLLTRFIVSFDLNKQHLL